MMLNFLLVVGSTPARVEKNRVSNPANFKYKVKGFLELLPKSPLLCIGAGYKRGYKAKRTPQM